LASENNNLTSQISLVNKSSIENRQKLDEEINNLRSKLASKEQEIINLTSLQVSLTKEKQILA
jgi:hypothetical protein